MSIAPVSPSPGPTVSGSGCADDETRFYIQFRGLERKASSPCSTSRADRSEEHTSELQSLMRISYAVFCLKKKTSSHGQTLSIPSLPPQSYTNTIHTYHTGRTTARTPSPP